MRGVTPDGRIVELTPDQALLVLAIGQWATANKQIVLPMASRGDGKSVILATVAEYDKRGWPDDLPEERP
jgi:hypothetical protein